MADACRSRRLRFGAWPDAEWISCLLRELWRHTVAERALHQTVSRNDVNAIVPAGAAV